MYRSTVAPGVVEVLNNSIGMAVGVGKASRCDCGGGVAGSLVAVRGDGGSKLIRRFNAVAVVEHGRETACLGDDFGAVLFFEFLPAGDTFLRRQ